MECISSSIFMPRSRVELSRKPTSHIIHMFFNMADRPPCPMQKWLFKEIQQRSMHGKIPQKIAILVTQKFLNNKNILKIGNGNLSYELNTLLLTSSSGYFRTVCRDWQSSCEFTINDCSNNLFHLLTNFFVTGEIAKVSLSEIMQLYAIAQEYQIEILIDYCHDRIAQFVEGIQFTRLPNGKISLEIYFLTEEFYRVFPLINTQCLDFLYFVSNLAIHGSVFEQNNVEMKLAELIKKCPKIEVAIFLNKASIRTAIPSILKWNEETAMCISHLEVETEAFTSNFASASNSSTLLLKLFSHCRNLRFCKLIAKNIQANELVEQILTMPFLESFTLDSQVTNEAFINITSALKVLRIVQLLPSIPNTLFESKQLQELSICVSLRTEDVFCLAAMPHLRKLELNSTIGENLIKRLLRHPPLLDSLEELTIEGDQLNDELVEIIAKSSLERVYFTNAKALTEYHMNLLKAMSNLQSFGLENAPLVTAESLNDLLNNTKVKELVLINCPHISNQSLSITPQKTFHRSCVRKYELSTPINKTFLAALLSQHANACPIEELTINGDQLTDELISIIANSYLTKVHFKKAHSLTDNHLQLLQSMRQLKVCGIEEATLITNEGLSEFVTYTRLKELFIQDCPAITEKFMDVPLCIKKVTFVGFSRLCDLQFLRFVQRLKLKNCKGVNSSVMKTLRSYSLKQLTIKNCPIGAVGISEIIDHLPGLEFIVYQPIAFSVINLTSYLPKIIVKNKRQIDLKNRL